MNRDTLLRPFPWHLYSRKVSSRIESPRCVGLFLSEDAEARQMQCIEGIEGNMREGNVIHLFWLVDPSDGIIVDAKFQAFGQSALIAAADAACELLIGKNHDQAKRVKIDLIDRHLRDHPDQPAFPEETKSHLELVVGAIEDAVEKCHGFPLPTTYVSPVPIEVPKEGGMPNWKELSKSEKLAVIEQVLNEEVRPYVELDAGGVEVTDLVNDSEILISYQGSCTSCYSAVGTTLSSIQQILQSKISSEITVVPNLDALQFRVSE